MSAFLLEWLELFGDRETMDGWIGITSCVISMDTVSKEEGKEARGRV